MVLLTECRICGERLEYNPDAVASLGVHAAVNHPQVDANYFEIDSRDSDEYDTNLDANGDNAARGWGRRGRDKGDSYNGRRSRSGRKLYKTTVETWKPGMGKLTCMICGSTGIPLLRRKRNLIARTPLGAFCMLGCWPLCFLPFLCGTGGRCINVYCSNCTAFIGTYNSKTGKLTPSECNAQYCPALQEATLASNDCVPPDTLFCSCPPLPDD